MERDIGSSFYSPGPLLGWTANLDSGMATGGKRPEPIQVLFRGVILTRIEELSQGYSPFTTRV